MSHDATGDGGLIDELGMLVCGITEDGTIRVFNRACERLTQCAREVAHGTNWLDWFTTAERHPRVRELWARAVAGHPAETFEGFCRQGRSVRWQFTRWARPAPAIALWAVGVDITHEREEHARAREVEREVALGNLVSGLTHELRNPLNGALLQLTVAERHVLRGGGAGAPAALAIGQASVELRRIAALLDDFLVFARPQPLRLARTALRGVAQRAVARIAAKAAAAGVQIVLTPGVDPVAEVDAARVESAIYQLLANAIDAAAEAGATTVEVRVENHRNTGVVEVADPGRGFGDSAGPIFEPFFTTKQGGTGLGLTIVERVAADHDGTIAHRRHDGWTVFRLELPIVGGAGN